jgi:toxin co-regulated pilin
MFVVPLKYNYKFKEKVVNLNKGRVKNSKKKNQGIALIEMLIVIGIIGLITAGIVALSTSVFRGMDEAEVISKLSTVKAKLQKGYKTQGNYAGVGVAVSGAIPLLEISDTQNPFGPDFLIGPVETNGQENGGATIKVGGLSIDSCQNILTTIDDNTFEYIGLEAGDAGTVPEVVPPESDIAVTIADMAAEFVIGGEAETPRTVGAVNTACAAAAGASNGMLVVGFY